MIQSSGLMLYRRTPDGDVEVLIGHMGGPFWAGQYERAWSFPKGIHDQGEHDHLAVALREFEEEMGAAPPDGPTVELGSVKSGRKKITIFAREGDFDARAAVSNTFSMEWPRGSGRVQEFPEIDEAAWASVAEARNLLTESQARFLDRLLDHLRSSDQGS